MMRLFIEGRQVDLMQDEALTVTREIADVREPVQRSSDWSKTFTLPGTSENNKLLGHIFDINQEQINSGTQFAPDFNPNKKAAAWVTVNEIELMRGFVRLLNISVVRRGEIQYEISVHGVVADLFTKMGQSRLSALDMDELNHQLSKTAIKNSWTNTAASGGYVYPMIDYGRGDKPDIVWSVDDFRPAVFAKVIVDKIFNSVGYTYTADSFFNTDFFKQLIVPFPGYPQLDEGTITGGSSFAQRDVALTAYTVGQTIVFNDDSSSGFYDNGNNFDTATGKYTSPNSGAKYSVYADLFIEITGLSSTTYPKLSAYFGVYSGGKFVEGFSSGIWENQAVTGVDTSFQAWIGEVYADAGDDIEIRFMGVFDENTGGYGVIIPSGYTFKIKAGSAFGVTPQQQSFGLNQVVDFNSMFAAGEWTQREFLNDLIKLFNLYLEPTEYLGQVIIKPRDEFYRNTVVHDLTHKIDLDQPMQIAPMGELEGNPYIFTYTPGTDIDSDEYRKQTTVAYGEARIFVDNDFIKQPKTIQTVMASTPYTTNSGGGIRIASMASDDKRIGQLRLLYWSGKIGTAQWLLCEAFKYTQFTNVETIANGYPHAGHLDNPFTPTVDLNYGMPFYVNLPGGITWTNNNLYNKYWRKYINEITDRNSRIVTVQVYITPADFAKWSFRDLYFFGGQYFRLNKIMDYAVGSSGLTACEFLKIKESAAFVPSTKDAGKGYDAKDNYNNTWPDLVGRFPGKKKRFAWTTTGGSGGGGKGPVYDVIQGITNITASDIGVPTTGDVYKVSMEWDTADFKIKLVKE